MQKSKERGCCGRVWHKLRTNFYRYCIAAFMFNLGSFNFWVLVPLAANDMKASSATLGAIQAVSSAVYAAAAIPFGAFVTDNLRTGVSSRIAVSLFLIGSGLVVPAKSVALLFVSVVFIGFGCSLYWISVQGGVGKEANSKIPAKADRRISTFSIFQSVGKAVGFVSAGSLRSVLGSQWTLGAMMVFVATQLAFSPLGPKIVRQPKTDLESAGSSNSPTRLTSSEPSDDGHGHAWVNLGELRAQSPSLHGGGGGVHDHMKTPVRLPSVSPATSPRLSMDSTSSRASMDSTSSRSSVELLPHHHHHPTPASVPVSPPLSPQIAPAEVLHAKEPAAAVDTALQAKIFLWMAWCTNFSAYGTMVCISNQYIKLILFRNISLGFGANPNETFLGVFLCVLYFAQALVFFIGGKWSKWEFHRWITYIMELLGVAMCFLVAELSNAFGLLAVALGLGLLAGFAYLSSYTYSFHSPGKKGRLVGLHEAVLTVSSIILPPVAGAISTSSGELRVPYWLCAGLLVLTVVVQEILYQVFWAVQHRKLAKAKLAPLSLSATTTTPFSTPTITPVHSPRQSTEGVDAVATIVDVTH